MAALFGFLGNRDSAALHRMADTLRHRGHNSPTYVENNGASFGYRSHVSDAGVLAQADAVVVGLSGRAESEDRSLSAQDLLVKFQREGLQFLEGVRGAFVIAIADGPRLHLARDGAGVRTIYFGRHRGRTFFAVEPKAILAVPGFPRRIQPRAIARYLTFSFQPGPETMLADILEAPPGAVVSCNGAEEPVTHRFFRFEEEPPQNSATDAEWTQRFRDLHVACVRDRLPQGQPVGVFLSGGIDSSIVAAEVVKQAAAPVHSFAVHFGKGYPNELEFARSVADRCQTQHHELEVRPKHFLPRLRQIIWHLDDPIGDPVAMPNFELARFASQHVRFVFNGEGGDPVFGGPKNIPMLLHHWYGVPRPDGFRERQYLAAYSRAYEEIPRLLTPEWRRNLHFRDDLENILTPFFNTPKPSSFLNKLMAINIRLKGAHLILPKVERMTAAWGITPLAPLFDERMIALSFRIPPRLKLDHGIEKLVLKRAYQADLPAEIIARPKSGMRVPVHYWFRGEMKRYAHHILHPKRLRAAGIFDPERVKQLLRYDTEEGPGRYGLRLWMLLTFEIWRRMVIEGEPV